MGQLVSSISLRPFFSLHDRLQECRNFCIRGWNCSFHTLTLGKPGMTWVNLFIPAFGTSGNPGTILLDRHLEAGKFIVGSHFVHNCPHIPESAMYNKIVQARGPNKKVSL